MLLSTRFPANLAPFQSFLSTHPPRDTEVIPNTTHPMFEQAPRKYSEIVLEFLAAR